MSRKKKAAKTGLAATARDLASSIYEHAGSFLIRTVCDALAEALRELADKVDELDGENSVLKWDLTQAENLIEDQARQITALEAKIDGNPGLFDQSNSLTGGQDLA